MELACKCGNKYPDSRVKTDILNTVCEDCEKKKSVVEDREPDIFK